MDHRPLRQRPFQQGDNLAYFPKLLKPLPKTDLEKIRGVQAHGHSSLLRNFEHVRWLWFYIRSRRDTMAMTIKDLSEKLAKIDFCMLTTNAAAGVLNSRPMSNNGDVEYDGDSWFFSY